MTSVTGGQRVIDNFNAMKAAGRKFPGLCLQATRIALDIPAKYGSARAAFLATPAANRHTGIAPKGFPMFYNIGKYGHVVTSSGDGTVGSNITKEGGALKWVSWKVFGHYWGWTDRLNGVDIVAPPAPPTAPEHQKPTSPSKPPKWRGAKYPGKVLKIGSRGAAVRELQFHLARKVTGVLTKGDAAAINSFVRARNKKYPRGRRGYLGAADGTAGPKTYKAITGHA